MLANSCRSVSHVNFGGSLRVGQSHQTENTNSSKFHCDAPETGSNSNDIDYDSVGVSEKENSELRKKKFVVLALPIGEAVCSGVYHFIRVMRSASLNPDSLQPIVIVVADSSQVDSKLRHFIALFPLVYYHIGQINTPRSLLRACIRGAQVLFRGKKI